MSQRDFGGRALEDPPSVSQAIREANRRIAEKAARLRFVSPVPFVCECADPRCHEFMPLLPCEYAERSKRTYVTLPGHPLSPSDSLDNQPRQA